MGVAWPAGFREGVRPCEPKHLEEALEEWAREDTRPPEQPSQQNKYLE
jgi:hypothetical protein